MGHASTSTDTTNTTSSASDSSSISKSPVANSRPRTSRPLPVIASSTVFDAEAVPAPAPSIRSSSAPAGRTVRWHEVQGEREDEQQEPDQVERVVRVDRLTGDGGDLVGADRQQIAAGHRLPGAEEVARPEGAAGAAGGDRHDHRLADRARDPEDDGGSDPRGRGGEDDLGRHAPSARTDPVRRLAERVGYRVHRVLGDRRHQRHRQDADPDARGQQVERAGVEKRFFTKSGLITARAKNPITTLGTPASVSMIGLRMRRSRPSEYSAR